MRDSRPKLLMIEDDIGLQRQLRWAYDNYQLLIAGNRREALAILREERPAVVTLDLGLPPDPEGISEGMAALREILAHAPSTKVIVASGHGERSSAREAIAEGAWDFYQKPIDFDSLGHIVGRAFHVHALEAENSRLAQSVSPPAHSGLGRIISADPDVLNLVRMAERVADTGVTVMLRGDSGTGKDLFAHGLHDESARAKGAFIAVNCATLADPSHNDALQSQIELADGGTLFLDGVESLPMELQAQLVRFMETQTLQRTGDHRPIPIHTRIVCATSHELEPMMADGRFREDLYYRLAEVVLRLPPLVDRPGDAALLARHFVQCHGPALNPQVRDLADDAIAAVDDWTWPGNVREVENRVKRGLALAQGRHLSARDLDLAGATIEAEESVSDLKSAREDADRHAIRRALVRTDGNIAAAARALGVSRPTLYELIRTYGLQAPPS